VNESNIECRECIIVGEGTTCWKEFAGVKWDVELCGSFNYVLLLEREEANTCRRIGVGVIQFSELLPDGNLVQI
jgi:hypothetical protein